MAIAALVVVGLVVVYQEQRRAAVVGETLTDISATAGPARASSDGAGPGSPAEAAPRLPAAIAARGGRPATVAGEPRVEPQDAPPPITTATPSHRAQEQPPASAETQPKPVPTTAPKRPPGDAGSHAFLQVQPGSDTPVGWDPCRTIHYVVRPGGAPPALLAMVPAALQSITRASGLRFANDGLTDEAPSASRPDVQQARYGKRWAPVLIAFTAPNEVPQLEGTVAGFGGAHFVPDDTDAKHRQVYVTGAVSYDTADLVAVLGRPNGEDLSRFAIMHELGHLVGLDHVADPTQVMVSELHSDRKAVWGAGDLAGLAIEGRQACHPFLAP